MRTHQMLQIDRWRAKGHPFPWVQPSLMKMVLPLVAVTCTPRYARLNPYWAMFIPLWDWSSAQPFPLTSNTGFTRIGATVLHCLALVLPGPTPGVPTYTTKVCRPWFLCEGKAAHRWVLGVDTVFICLAQLKTLLGARLEGICVAEWARTIWLKGRKQCLDSLLLFTVICTLISQYGSTSHPFRVVKITAGGSGESQLGAL